MKLWFQNNQDNEYVIADCKTGDEVNKAIKQFIDEKNKNKDKPFKSYYTRVWEENNRLAIDIGSHTEFFFWEGTMNDYLGVKEIRKNVK